MRRIPPGVLAATGTAVIVAAALWHGGVRADDDPSISAVQYNREVVRIFERKCVACHSKGALSLPLDSYRDVRPWARAIREELLERRMPPWSAAPGLLPLANDPTLTPRELSIVTAWTDGGTPRGEPADLPAPKAKLEWPGGAPTVVVALPAQTIISNGTPQVRRVRVGEPATVERWLRGFDLVAGERRALRSAFLFVDRAGGGEQWLGGWTPWHAMVGAPAGAGFRIPAGAALLLELHYLAWDEPAASLVDSTRVGLYVQPGPPPVAAEELALAARPLAAPAARDGRTKLRSEVTVPAPIVLWAFRPRLDRGGAPAQGSVEVIAKLPDGGVQPLLWVRENGPEWQFPYVLRDPLPLPRGATLTVIAYGAAAQASADRLTARVSVLTYAPALAETTAGGRSRAPAVTQR